MVQSALPTAVVRTTLVPGVLAAALRNVPAGAARVAAVLVNATVEVRLAPPLLVRLVSPTVRLPRFTHATCGQTIRGVKAVLLLPALTPLARTFAVRVGPPVEPLERSVRTTLTRPLLAPLLVPLVCMTILGVLAIRELSHLVCTAKAPAVAVVRLPPRLVPLTSACTGAAPLLRLAVHLHRASNTRIGIRI